MMPPESDAVVMVEYTDETEMGLVEIHRGVSPWQNVIQIGDSQKANWFSNGGGSGHTTCAHGIGIPFRCISDRGWRLFPPAMR
jgi:hypothetical protein